eukprot:8660148-Alexandrium_andersonii.AAC.1
MLAAARAGGASALAPADYVRAAPPQPPSMMLCPPKAQAPFPGAALLSEAGLPPSLEQSGRSRRAPGLSPLPDVTRGDAAPRPPP